MASEAIEVWHVALKQCPKPCFNGFADGRLLVAVRIARSRTSGDKSFVVLLIPDAPLYNGKVFGEPGTVHAGRDGLSCVRSR